MINVLISGITGPIGKAVYEYAKKEKDVFVACGVDESVNCECDCPVYKSFDEVKEMIDVVIDFSSPEFFGAVYKFVKDNDCSLVEGTTGYTQKNLDELKRLAENKAIFASRNLSLGTNTLFKLCVAAAKELKNFDVEIIERYEKNKSGVPGGTTLSLAKAIQEAIGLNGKIIYGRTSRRKDGEICIHSVRGGGIQGEKEVLFIGEKETLSIIHRDDDKSLYAETAISVARFIVSRSPGLYSMNDYYNAEKN